MNIENFERFFEGSLHHIAQKGWVATKIGDLGSFYPGGMQEFHAQIPHKDAYLKLLIQFLDAKTRVHLPPDLESYHLNDRLFEVFMGRLEVSTPYKEGLRAIWADETASITQLLASIPPLLPLGYASMDQMLEAARVPRSSPMGCLRVQGFGLLYLMMVRTWLMDESPDQQKTMAAVGGLIERFATYLV